MRINWRCHRTLGLFAIWGLLALAVSLSAWLIVQPILRSSARAFREDCLVYALAFVNSIHAWQATGGDAPLTPVAQYALVSGLAYAQVEFDGKRLLDVRQPYLDPPAPIDTTGERIAGMATRSISGRPILDIVLPYAPIPSWDAPRPPAGGGYVRLGINASDVSTAARRFRRIGTWIAIGSWLALCGGAGWIDHRLRRSRPSRHAPHDPAFATERGPVDIRRLTAGNIILFLDEGRLEAAGRSVELTPKQQRILELLMREPGRAFSDAEILAAVWPESQYANSRDVKQYVYLIRKRLTAAGLPANELLANVPGLGYRIAVEAIDAGVDPEIDPPSVGSGSLTPQDRPIEPPPKEGGCSE